MSEDDLMCKIIRNAEDFIRDGDRSREAICELNNDGVTRKTHKAILTTNKLRDIRRTYTILDNTAKRVSENSDYHKDILVQETCRNYSKCLKEILDFYDAITPEEMQVLREKLKKSEEIRDAEREASWKAMEAEHKEQEAKGLAGVDDDAKLPE